MAEDNKKKKSILSMEISFGGKKNESVKIPNKRGINFIHNDRHTNNVHAVMYFVIFLAVLGLFTYFGIFRLIQKQNEAEAAYNNMQAQIDDLKASMKDYDDVAKEYGLSSGSFMSEDEVKSVNRMEILAMVDDDIGSSIALSDIHITGSKVSVNTAATKLETVSSVLTKLQQDDRNSYATVTTTAADSSSDNDLVLADFEITYAGGSDETKTKTSSEKLTIDNAPFIADQSTRKFHKRDCEQVAQIADINKVPFATAKDALAEGYVADEECNPS